MLWSVEATVREGRLNEARDLVTDLVESALDEPGTRGYEFYLSNDDKVCHIYERYVDSEAALIHLDNFKNKFAERYFACFDQISLTVYGRPNKELQAALDEIGATYLLFMDGFNRR